MINQILAGQSETFWELVRPHLPAVSRMVRVRMGDDGEVEDVLQDTLLKAFTHLRQFRFESNFRTWLTRIAINEVRQSYRRPIRSRCSGFEDCGIKESELLNGLPSQLETCEQQEKVERIGLIVARLPEKYRTVIQLREFEQLSVADTARALRLSISAVKSRHQRAWMHMRKSIPALPSLRVIRVLKPLAQERGVQEEITCDSDN